MNSKRMAWLVGLCVVALVACGDDETKPGVTCTADEVVNPLTGQCVPRTGAPNNLNSVNNANSVNNQNSTQPDMAADDMGTSGDTGADMTLPTDCEGSERRCNNGSVETCVNGTFQVTQVCENGLICERGNCIPDGNSCTVGETRCASQTSIETCQPDGMSWGGETACGANEACAEGECTSGCNGLLNEKSNVGCEYFTMRHNQASGIRVLPHSVVVSNPGADPVTVKVTSPAGLNPGIPDTTIPPLDSAVLTFPTSPMISTAGVSSNIYVIRSSEPVIATQFSPLNNPGLGSETSDASLLLPTNAIGQEYYVLGWRALQPGGTYVDVVALEPNTTVTVESPLPLSGGAAGSVAANSSAVFTVQESQVLHLAENRGLFSSGNRDVSGVRIVSDKPVAVYTGGTIINIPDEPIRANPPSNCVATAASCAVNDDCCSGLCAWDRNSGTNVCSDSLAAGDHVEQQLFPVDTWGSSYIAAPYVSRGVNDFTIYRVIASQDATTVTLAPPVNGLTTFTLNAGDVREIYSSDAFELSATQPVMLAQFMIGGQISSSDDGDPAFMIPPAIQQYRDSYVFLVPGQYRENYVTLIKETGSTVTLDGTAVSQMLFQPVGGGTMWEYAIIDNVSAGVHRASSPDAFGVVVHGMDEYISYAYAGGIILPN